MDAMPMADRIVLNIGCWIVGIMIFPILFASLWIGYKLWMIRIRGLMAIEDFLDEREELTEKRRVKIASGKRKSRRI